MVVVKFSWRFTLYKHIITTYRRLNLTLFCSIVDELVLYLILSDITAHRVCTGCSTNEKKLQISKN